MKKKLLLGAGAVLFAVGAVIGYRLLRETPRSMEDAEPDGGVTQAKGGTDAQKTIQSTDITDFDFLFSLLSVMEEDLPREDSRNFALKNAVYSAKASLVDGKVQGWFRFHDRFGEGDEKSFEADPSFMVLLQEIVLKHQFALYNGHFHEVKGLPEMYGVSLALRYASGEGIYAYDNQDIFLPLSAIAEIAALFQLQVEKSN